MKESEQFHILLLLLLQNQIELIYNWNERITILGC
jgi:hypothetical protein